MRFKADILFSPLLSPRAIVCMCACVLHLSVQSVLHVTCTHLLCLLANHFVENCFYFIFLRSHKYGTHEIQIHDEPRPLFGHLVANLGSGLRVIVVGEERLRLQTG